MEITYKKDGRGSFLIITPEQFDESDYKYQMFKNNSLKSLLRMNVKTINNRDMFYYDTTSMTSLKSVFSKRLMCGNDFLMLLKNLKKMSDALKEYLLDVEDILLDPEYIYKKNQTEEYYFCYYPASDYKDKLDLRNLFDSLLEFINHNDHKAVEIAYGIEQLTIGDSYSIQELLEFANEKIKKEKTPEIKEEKIEENIFEIPEKKTGFFDRIIERFKKKNYQSKEELSEQFDENEFRETMQDETGEDDATVFLSAAGEIYSLTLKSVDLETPIVIHANTFPCIFGKSKKSCDYVIDSPVVSRVHMRLSADREGYYIEDLNSTNGTYKNEIRLSAHTPEQIGEGDKITIANIDFVVA